MFRNKEGQQIDAEVVAIGGSMRTVTIVRPDGRRFDIEIVSLSLDDQQYLKAWLRDQASITAEEANLRIEAQPLVREAERQRFEDRIYGGSGVQSQFGYQFSITNLTRHPLVDVSLEYAVLLHDLVAVRDADPADPETVRWRPSEDGPIVYRSGKISLEPLKYNTIQQIATETLPHEAMRGGSNAARNAEDVKVGVVARLVSGDGTILSEFVDIDRDYPQLTWEDFSGRRDTTESDDGLGKLVESVASR